MATLCSNEHMLQTANNPVSLPLVSSISRNQYPARFDISLLPQNPPSIKGRYRFLHYEEVLKIFEGVKRSGKPHVNIDDSLNKLRTLQDVMEILFYESVIDDMLLESGFYSRFLKLHGHKAMVRIMAYDFQKYKFAFRPPKSSDGIPELMLTIAEALWNYRVKLSATLARMRVCANAQSIVQLLPPNNLSHYYALSTTPVYVRINTTPKSESWPLFMSELQELGVSIVSEPSQLMCGHLSAAFISKDLIVMSPDCRTIIYNQELKKGPLGVLFPQDASSYFSISKLAPWLKSLDETNKDIVITNCDKGTIPGHISSIMKGSGRIFVFGVAPAEMKQIQGKLSAMSVDNVQLIPVLFPRIDPSDEVFSNVGMVFCNPPCSLTSVQHPIDYIMQEGDNYVTQLLNTQPLNTSTLIREQSDHLANAMRFGQADHIAYFTRSTMDIECREIVEAVMRKHVNEVEKDDQLQQFEVILNVDYQHKESHGYLCTFKHVPPKPAPVASDVIAQAIKKGILNGDGLMFNYEPQKLKKRKTKKRIFSQHEGIPLTFATKQKMVQKKEVDFNKPRPFL